MTGIQGPRTLKQASKYSLIWGASIKPAQRKLVLMCMAKFGNDDGTRIFPAVEKVAKECGLWPSATRSHIHALVKCGFLQIIEKASQRRPTIYALCLPTIAKSGGLKESSTPEIVSAEDFRTRDPSFQDSRFQTLGLTISGADPNDPDVVRVERGGGLVPGPSARHRPQLEVEMPEWLNAAAMQRALEINPKRDATALVETAIEYLKEGVSADSINAELVSMGKRIHTYKLRLVVSGDAAQTITPKRSAGRKEPLLTDPGHDTRSKDYSAPECAK